MPAFAAQVGRHNAVSSSEFALDVSQTKHQCRESLEPGPMMQVGEIDGDCGDAPPRCEPLGCCGRRGGAAGCSTPCSDSLMETPSS